MSAASSMGSPPVSFHTPMQSQHHSTRPDSPLRNMLPSHLKSPTLNGEHFGQGPQNTIASHPVYNSMNSHHSVPNFSSLSSENDSFNQPTDMNGFIDSAFRAATTFNPFPPPNRTRHQPPYRDTPSNYHSPPYVPADIFVQHGVQMPTSQSQPFSPVHSYDSMQQGSRQFDFAVGGQGSGIMNNGMSQVKQSSYGPVEPYRQTLDTTTQTSQVKQHGPVGGPLGTFGSTQQSQIVPQHSQGGQQSFQTPYLNGTSHSHTHHGPMQSQSTFGGPGSGPVGSGQGSTLTSAPGLSHANGGVQGSQQQEEISTIFVVGFPDDMQEREFQNMFTFSSGFEAATLKIPNNPNKEYSTYGSNGLVSNGRLGTVPVQYGGSNDPYNVVTVNQGGVVVDGGRDGPTTSWPAVVPMPTDDGHFMSNMPQQRKQIIGFAKFRTRQEALEARDVLQGRRVDIEKGSVLKAEMAKKNLHTKRGPGVGTLGTLGSGPTAETLPNVPSYNSLSGSTNETLTQRERELGVLGALGIGRRDRVNDDRDDDRRRADIANVNPLSTLGTRGPRERAEDDERERERKRKEKEAARLMQNSYAFEAFHSVPQQMVRQGMNSLLSAENGTPRNEYDFAPANSQNLSHGDGATSPTGNGSAAWGSLRDVSASAALRKMPIPVQLLPNLPARPPSTSPLQASPPSQEMIATSPSAVSSQNGNRSAPFSPQSNTSSLPSHPSLPSRPRPYSPSNEPQSQQVEVHASASSSHPLSSSSSSSGSQSGLEEDLSRALVVSTSNGTTSPQLPSPASGASSGRNPADQNPPINTLYVGNLPTGPSPGSYQLTTLEDSLRELFSKRPGYRKLSFRQKSNGLMCFVEFEDVAFATKALQELNGVTLNGLIKGGGIRLSYSKNPLGVRTPTGNSQGQTIQLQQQGTQLPSINTHPFLSNAVSPRQSDSDLMRPRRDTSGMTSPTSSYHYAASPPPPRFVSPPPATPFTLNPTSFPRAGPQGYGFVSGVSTMFSPFGLTPHPTIPDQPSADINHEHITHTLAPTTANVEASRAG